MAHELQSVGSLEETQLLQVFLWIENHRFSGVLALAKEKVKKTLIFDGGKAIAARSNIKGESLGQMLKSEGRLTQEQLAKSLEILKSKEANVHGEALVAMGVIDYAALNEVLRKQLLKRLYEAFSWAEGRYGLIDKVPEGTSPIQLDQSLVEIAFRALIEKYKNSEKANSLSPETKPIPIGGTDVDFDALRLVGREMGFYRSINGVNTVEQILAKSRMDEETSRGMFLALHEMQFIRIDDLELTQPVEEPKKEAPRAAPRPAPATGSQASAKAAPTSPPAGDGGRFPVVEEALKRVKDAENQNLFELLGTTQKASSNDVKKAYFEMARKFHPDRLPPGVSPEDRKTVESFFAHVSEAHTMLSNDEARKEYEATLELEASGMKAEDAQNVLESEVKFQEGVACIRKGDFGGAVINLKEAVSKYDKEAEYFLQLGWAQFRKSSRSKSAQDGREGRENIAKALKMNNELVDGFYYKGMIAKSENDLDAAERYFTKTLELRRNHNEANSELRLLNMRKEKKKGAGLKGLFGKK